MFVDTTGSGVFVGLLGVAYYAEIHHISYFIVIQIFVGIFEVKRLYVCIECYYILYIYSSW